MELNKKSSGTEQEFKTSCSIVNVMNLIGGKWRITIIWYIGITGTVRYNELKRKIIGITNTMLTRCLVELADSKIIQRKNFGEIPPKVEYSLTPEGQELFTTIVKLNEWGDKHANFLKKI